MPQFQDPERAELFIRNNPRRVREYLEAQLDAAALAAAEAYIAPPASETEQLRVWRDVRTLVRRLERDAAYAPELARIDEIIEGLAPGA